MIPGLNPDRGSLVSVKPAAVIAKQSSSSNHSPRLVCTLIMQWFPSAFGLWSLSHATPVAPPSPHGSRYLFLSCLSGVKGWHFMCSTFSHSRPFGTTPAGKAARVPRIERLASVVSARVPLYQYPRDPLFRAYPHAHQEFFDRASAMQVFRI